MGWELVHGANEIERMHHNKSLKQDKKQLVFARASLF
jgi:hypothetical protein